jgi:hypothetical protein
MFKDLKSGLSKFFTKERVLILIIFFVLSWALLSYSGSKINVYDGMDSGSYVDSTVQQQQQHAAGSGSGSVSKDVVTSHVQNVTPNMGSGSGYSQQSVANPSDLLPQDQNSQWAALNPNTMNQGSVLMPDLLQAGYHIGLDTIGQTLRNPNLQLRSDPIIPKSDIGPWNQSTIEADIGRVPLEIGQGPK